VTYQIKLKPKPPKVFVGIPTGWTKEYSLLYMLAALREVDYNPNYMKICFAVTDLGDSDSRKFIKDVKALVEHSNFMCETEVITTTPTEQEHGEWGSYSFVVKNQRVLRQKAIDEDWQYWWILGGDNPPPRKALKRLMALNADIAYALVYQRPIKDFHYHKAWPLVFRHVWTIQDLEHNGLNEEQKRLLTKAWVEVGFMRQLCIEKNWRIHKVLRNVASGDGCCLVKRQVFEKVPYRFGKMGYQSPDLQFYSDARVAGFNTVVDMKLHCPHIAMDGLAY